VRPARSQSTIEEALLIASRYAESGPPCPPPLAGRGGTLQVGR
jgi:hypothetical protein